MEQLQQKRRYTIAEYLKLERAALDKHEYRNGEIVMMAGGTNDHSLIIANMIRELGNRLEGKPCRVYDSNLRVRIPRTVLYTYPDVSVICQKPEPDPNDEEKETVLNPCAIVEVLSPSTEAYDRGDKFKQYLMLDSLQDYLLVSQTTPWIGVFSRRDDGTWLFAPAIGLECSAKLPSLGVEVSLRAVYSGVDFPPEAQPQL